MGNNTVVQLPELEPVTILITSYNRLNLLQNTINKINERTFYPYRIIVIDNNSTDGSVGYIKSAKVQGKIFDHIFMPENVGQSRALNEGFAKMEWWENEHRRPSSDFFVTTNDDIYPPMLGQKNCWLRRMIDILQRHEPDYGGICMRIQRTPRTDIDESTEIIPCYKGFPSVFRLMRRSDIRQLGDRPFGRLMKWDSNTSGDKYKTQICKKFGFATHIYADHAGFIRNKGYPEDVETFTVAANKITESDDKPYPDIDPLTNVPIKINHPVDTAEQKKREEYQAVLNGTAPKTEVTNIILTCKRLDGLKRIVESVIKTTAEIKNDILVIADNDDTDAYNYCQEVGVKCILSGFHRDFGAQANLGAYACETPYFTILSDDQEFVDLGWLSRALASFKKAFPDGVGLMPFNEDIQRGRIFTVGMSSKMFIDAMRGHMYYPGYKHYKGDREVTELARKLGYYHYDELVKINHYHFSKGAEKDETYRNSENLFLRHDRDLKSKRDGDVDLLLKRNHYDW